MSENGRYVRLTETENGSESEREPMLNDHDSIEPATTPSLPPPSYSTSHSQDEAHCGESSTNELPPAYDVAAKLPTYEEAELTKHRESGFESSEERDYEDPGVKLGTDGLFAVCFVVAFIFNWIGFIFAYCVTNTIAGRYGALSGFGLSLIKWVFIFKHSHFKDLVFQDAWLWWLLALLGWLIFIRGILVYAQVKKIVRAGHAIYIPRYWGLRSSE